MKSTVRLFGWLLALGLLALPVVGVLEGWFAAKQWPVRHLKVQADMRHIDPNQLRAAVTPLLNQGFFALDLHQIQHAVAALPWVESVEVSKHWPDTVSIQIETQQPFARWNQHQLISQQGTIFDAGQVPIPGNLPMLSGPDDQLSAVMDFYVQLQKAFNAPELKVVGLSLSERGSWSMRLASGAEIMIGDSDQAGARLRRFLDVYPQLRAQRGQGFAYVDLRYTNGFAVRWATKMPPAMPQGSQHS